MNIRTPLRYPGGKAKALGAIFAQFPDNFTEFREPFVGGGSVFIAVRQRYPQVPVWINDLNVDLYSFWISVRDHNSSLVKEVRRIKDTASNGQLLYEEIRNTFQNDLSTFERGIRFFVLNRITFSGTADSGGYSQGAFDNRFTYTSIERVERLEELIQGVKITNLDYQEVISQGGKNTYLFLDPPYLTATKSKLYGKGGDLHVGFEHASFSELLKSSTHKWLITYDDCVEIRENFNFAEVEAWELQYGMNNYMKASAAKGKELFIRNYKICNGSNADVSLF